MVSLASHLTTGKSPAGPREAHPWGLPQPRGRMTGLGSCWSNVPACFGSMSREKALGSSGSSYLHGTIRKKTSLDPTKSPWLHRGVNSQWRSGGAKGFLMFSRCSSCPRCSHAVPSSQPANPPAKAAPGQEAAPQAAAHPKQTSPNQTHHPETHTVV